MAKYKKFENRADAHWQYTTRDKDMAIRAFRKVIRQAIKDGEIAPIDKTAIMKLGQELEQEVYEYIIKNLKEGKYNKFIASVVYGD